MQLFYCLRSGEFRQTRAAFEMETPWNWGISKKIPFRTPMEWVQTGSKWPLAAPRSRPLKTNR
jgi:hypothetical protein